MSDLLTQIPLLYQPIQNNRFVVKFPSDMGIQSWTVASSGLPSLNQNSIEIPWMNTSDYVLGRATWEKIDVVFRNLIGPSTAQSLMEWIRLGYEEVTGRQGYAAGYKRDISIELLDPTGVTIQKWILKNAFPTTTSFGSLKYDDDAINEITVSIQYTYGILVF